MKRQFVVLLAGLAAYCSASAQIPVFSVAPDATHPIFTETHPAVVADYAVAPNIRALAVNLARDRPEPVVFALPGADSARLDLVRAAPLEGFELSETGALVVTSDAPDEGLSFDLYAVARGRELSLVVRRGRVTGSLTGMFGRIGQAWTIVESRGQLVLRELDTSKSPREPEDYASGPKSDALPHVSHDKRAIDGGGTVDILVLHTANALAVAGGQAPMDDLIIGSFVDMQTALDNSQAYRVRVNHVLGNGLTSQFVGYDESPGVASNVQRWYAHRRWARTNAAAIDMRNAFQADLVVLVVGDAGFCGVAYTQRPLCGDPSGDLGCNTGDGYENFAVSVISTSPACGLPTRTFAHEVGHQFGMEHDPPNGAAAAAASFPWSYGHTVSTPQVQARSIMAYETAGPCPLGCPIQLHYSNPAVDFQAFPGTPSGQAGADAQGRTRINARTAVLFAPRMERFRGPAAADFGIFGHGFEPLPGIVCNPAIWPNCPSP